MKKADCDRIMKAVRASRDDMTSFTSELVAIATENPPGTNYRPCVELIAHKLSTLGMDSEIVEIPTVGKASDAEEYPRFAVKSQCASGGRRIYFHGHYDVVPADAEDQFAPRLDDAALFGRGSSDMKSGLAAMVYAAHAIQSCGLDLNGTIALTVVPDEETGGILGSKYLSEAGLLGENGIGMLMPEPTSGVVWNACRGAISLLVTVRGVPMHVGLQHEGVNAFDNMVIVASALTGLKREVELRCTEYNIAPDPARRSILMLGGRCEGGTNFNLVPGECSFTIDRRINPEEDLETEKQLIFDVLDSKRNEGIELDIEVLQEGESAGVSERSQLARALTKNVELVTGRRPAFEMCPGLLEIRFFATMGVPAFAYGPGILSVSHGPREYVPVQNIVDCAAVYALTAADILAD